MMIELVLEVGCEEQELRMACSGVTESMRKRRGSGGEPSHRYVSARINSRGAVSLHATSGTSRGALAPEEIDRAFSVLSLALRQDEHQDSLSGIAAPLSSISSASFSVLFHRSVS